MENRQRQKYFDQPLAVAGILGSLLTPSFQPKTSRVTPKPVEVCVADDNLKNNDFETSLAAAKRDAALGATCVRITLEWVKGQIPINRIDSKGLDNAETAAKQAGLEKLRLALYPCPPEQCPNNVNPTRQWERGKFSRWVSTVVSQTDINEIIIGNENNSSYFQPNQDNPGKDYERLLARSYDVIKKIGVTTGRDITVIGGTTAARGTTPTWKFIEQMGEAYRSSGRQKPIMDEYDHHPYPDTAQESPEAVHQGKTIGIADYPKLIEALGKAFDGTTQAGSKLPIIYGEFGVQTDTNGLKGYIGNEKTSTTTEKMQAKYTVRALGMSACQPNVVSFTYFQAKDDRQREQYGQSGLYYATGQPKSDAPRFAEAATKAAEGSLVSEC